MTSLIDYGLVSCPVKRRLTVLFARNSNSSLFCFRTKVDITRRARTRGPTGFQLWAAASLAVAYGFYRVGQGNKQRSGEKLEERKARYAMAPFLQAEEDRWYAEREREIMKQEAEIMKNVPGWEVGAKTFHSDRWVPRHVAPLDKNLKK